MRPFIRKSWFLILLLWLGQWVAACTSSPTLPSKKNTTTVRILVSNPGAVQISSTDLQRLGLFATSAEDLSLSLRGIPVPFWYSEQNGNFQLYFWGERGKDSTANTNVYLLSTTGQPTAKKPLPLQISADANAKTIGSTWTTWENNILYSSHAPLDDPWFWLMLRAPEEQTIRVQLNQQPYSGNSKIELRLWSATSNKSAKIDHQVTLQINGQTIITESWQGVGEHWLRAEIVEGVFKLGENQITLILPGIENVAEITYLDEIVFSYPIELKAVNDHILLNNEDDNTIYQLSGFSSPAVWIYDIDEVSAWKTNATNGQIFFPALQGHHYAIWGNQGGAAPDEIQIASVNPVLVYNNDMPANYVVIGASSMLTAYQPVVDLRAQQGWHTWVVDWNSLCDQYNAGFAEPQAIQKFLHVGITNKQIDPNALIVLLGDATYQPNQQRSTRSLLPTSFIETAAGGQSPSDVPIVDLNQDDKPDLAIGRIPAQNPDQLKILVQKILAYEKAAQPTSILAIADGQETQFQASAQIFLDSVPQNFKKQLYTPSAGTQEAATVIQQKFQDDIALIAYFGHGSLKMWGKDRLLTINDVQKLSNQSYPVLLQMTCLTGYFVHPEISSISEEMLWQPNGGAIATISSTGLTFPEDQHKFSQTLIEILLRPVHPTIGEALLHTWQSLPDEPGANDVMKTFLLLGDPALRISTSIP